MPAPFPAATSSHVDDKAWRKGWELKVFGYVNLTRAYFTLMKEREARRHHQHLRRAAARR